MSFEGFTSKLTLLNKEFTRYISKQLVEYPSADLTPCLKSYFKHVRDLDNMYADKNGEKKSDRVIKKPLPPSAKIKTFDKIVREKPKPIEDKNPTNDDNPKILSGNQKLPTVNLDKTSTTPLSLGQPSSAPLSFGQTDSPFKSIFSSGQPTAGGLSLGQPSLGFTLGQPSLGSNLFGVNPASTTDNNNEEEEKEEEPPKVESVEQKEKDAILSAKCSVHVMNEKAWDKMGVAYCNVVEKDEKKTFIVRAATTVGTIWINTLINNHFKSFVMTEKKLKIRFPTTVKVKKTVDGKEEATDQIKIVTYLITVGSPEECKKLAKLLNAHDIHDH